MCITLIAVLTVSLQASLDGDEVEYQIIGADAQKGEKNVMLHPMEE